MRHRERAGAPACTPAPAAVTVASGGDDGDGEEPHARSRAAVAPGRPSGWRPSRSPCPPAGSGTGRDCGRRRFVLDLLEQSRCARFASRCASIIARTAPARMWSPKKIRSSNGFRSTAGEACRARHGARPAGGGDAVEGLVGSLVLLDPPGPEEAALHQFGRQCVELALRRRPEEPDAALDRLQ